MCSVGDELSIQTVDTLRVGAVLAELSGGSLFVLQVNCSAVEALAAWSVVAFRFVLHLGFAWGWSWLGGVRRQAVEAFPSWGVVALGRSECFPELM